MRIKNKATPIKDKVRNHTGIYCEVGVFLHHSLKSNIDYVNVKVLTIVKG